MDLSLVCQLSDSMGVTPLHTHGGPSFFTRLHCLTRAPMMPVREHLAGPFRDSHLTAQRQTETTMNHIAESARIAAYDVTATEA